MPHCSYEKGITDTISLSIPAAEYSGGYLVDCLCLLGSHIARGKFSVFISRFGFPCSLCHQPMFCRLLDILAAMETFIVGYMYILVVLGAGSSLFPLPF